MEWVYIIENIIEMCKDESKYDDMITMAAVFLHVVKTGGEWWVVGEMGGSGGVWRTGRGGRGPEKARRGVE